MNFLRRTLLPWVLSFSFTAQATLADPEPIAAGMKFVDLYIQAAQNKAQVDSGQAALLGDALSVQIAAMEPEDFNLFILPLLLRYVQEPANRNSLGIFIGIIQSKIQDELNTSEAYRQGPLAAAIHGSYEYGLWFLLAMGGAGLGWRILVQSENRAITEAATAGILRAGPSTIAGKAGAKLIALQNLDAMLIERSPIYRMGTKVRARSKWLTSATLGAYLGYRIFQNQAGKVQKIDPSVMLKVAQASAACTRSYDALELLKRGDDLAVDTETKYGSFISTKFLTEYPQYATEMSALISDIRSLRDHFPQLNNLYIQDQAFGQMLAALPQDGEWNALQKDLITNGVHSADGKCSEIGLDDILRQLLSKESDLNLKYDKAMETAPLVLRRR